MASNRYRLPAQFPNIIKFLDKVSADLPDRPISGKMVRVHGTYAIVLPTKVYILGSHGGAAGIDGVLADRFNTSVYAAIEAFSILYPKLSKEADAFDSWLSSARSEDTRKKEMKDLEALAAKYGYVPAGKRSKVEVTDTHVDEFFKVLRRNGKTQNREAYRRALSAVINGK